MGRTKLGRGSFINSELIREPLKEFQGKGAFTNVLLLTGNALRTPSRQLKATAASMNFSTVCGAAVDYFFADALTDNCQKWNLFFSLAFRLVSEHSRIFPATSKLQNMPLTFKVATIKYLFFGANPSGNYLN